MDNKRGKVFFIYPPSPVLNREDRCQQPINELLAISPLPPTDLMYMAAVAERCGYEAKIKDYSQGGDFIQDIRTYKPDYLVANIATPTFKSDIMTVKAAKELCPNLVTIVKGAPFLTYNSNTIYENPFVDYVIMGEPELTLQDILSGVPNDEILGICYRENFQPVKNEKRPFNDKLDDLPFPARHLVDNTAYKRPNDGKVQAVIKVARGCPFNCFFCLATPVSGSKVRVRSAENIVAEIKECVEKYNIRNFLFWSDIFNLDRAWMMNLCQNILDSGLKITWSANTSSNTIDEEMANLMHKAGCRLVELGVESGSQKMLNNIGKRGTLDDIRRTVKILKNNKIKVYNSFVIGLPWETEETVEETVKFAIELDSDYVSFYAAAPLPGTKFFAYAMTNQLIEGGLDFTNAYSKPVVRTHTLTKERVAELRKQALKRFYLRPKFIFRTLFSLRSFTEVKNFFNTVLALVTKR